MVRFSSKRREPDIKALKFFITEAINKEIEVEKEKTNCNEKSWKNLDRGWIIWNCQHYNGDNNFQRK